MRAEFTVQNEQKLASDELTASVTASAYQRPSPADMTRSITACAMSEQVRGDRKRPVRTDQDTTSSSNNLNQ